MDAAIQKPTYLFAVKRGKCLTLFEHFLPAAIYWRATLGGVLMYKYTLTSSWQRIPL